MSVFGNAVGGITGYGKTFIIEDENGSQITGVVVGEEVVFTADPVTDIRKGKIAATEGGVVVGQKDIPAYYVYEGYRLISAGSQFIIVSDEYDYTRLQAIICPFNTSLSNSVASEKVVIGDSVYNSGSTNVLSLVSKDFTNERIDLGITNDTDNRYIIRYFMYKEEY